MSQSNSKEINPLVSLDDQGGADAPLRYASDPTPEQAAELPTLELTQPNPSDGYEGRCRQTLLLAEEAFAKTGSWVIFFREILGVQGVVQQLFPDPEELKQFMAGPDYATLHEMLAAIRSQDQSKSDAAEPERMITIRIPRSLHELLQEESKSCGLSINKLSISKLLWPANPRFVPEQQGRRRGRKPGPQGARSRTDSTEDRLEQGEGRLQQSEGRLQQSEGRLQQGERLPEAGQINLGDRAVTHSWADQPIGNSGGAQ